MLRIREPQKPRQLAGLCLLLMLMCGTAVARTGPGDVRDGYERSDYRSRSEKLRDNTGMRLPLAQLAQTVPLGLPPLPQGSDEGLSKAAVDLGRRLFFDRRLSVNGTLSCGMCHIPEQGFTQNELATPLGIEGRSVRRNAPSLYNVAFSRLLFHDGREAQLARQVWEPLLAANEMGNASREQVVERVARLDDYAQRFSEVYTAGLTSETLGLPLAAYQRALLSADSRFDRWYFGGSQQSLNAQEQAGFALFESRGCSSCHVIGPAHALFTNGAFYNTGIGFRAQQKARQPARVQLAPGVFIVPSVAFEMPALADDGRVEVTLDSADKWKYRTPSLRNVALTGPYMHDGSLASLQAVIDYYNAGGAQAPGQDGRIKRLALNQTQADALLAFLHTLTGSNVDALAADARSVSIGDVR